MATTVYYRRSSAVKKPKVHAVPNSKGDCNCPGIGGRGSGKFQLADDGVFRATCGPLSKKPFFSSLVITRLAGKGLPVKMNVNPVVTHIYAKQILYGRRTADGITYGGGLNRGVHASRRRRGPRSRDR